MPILSKQSCRNKVDEALAPSRSLDEKESTESLDDVTDSFLLAVSKPCIR
jgi:hypothetical protein